MQYFNDELMTQLIVARRERIAETMEASRRGTRVGIAVRRNLGLSLIWLGEKLRQEVPPCPPELVPQS